MVAVLGCAPGVSMMRSPRILIRHDRLVAMPANIDTFEVDADEKVTHPDDWTDRCALAVGESIAYRMSASGARTFGEDALQKLEPSVDYQRFKQETRKTLIEIGWWPVRKFNQRSVDEWRLTSGFPNLATALRADFAVVSLFLDGHETTGFAASKLLNPLGVVGAPLAPHAVQWALACVITLTDGAVVGCNRATVTDMHARAPAQRTIDSLLAPLLFPPFEETTSAPPAFVADPRDEPISPTIGPHEEVVRLDDFASSKPDESYRTRGPMK
jgi:hypothetical protein